MPYLSLEEELRGNSYPGRGIIIGRSEDAAHAVIAYFIMGRSENSRNRIFVADGEGIRTQPYDPAKLEDPSLIIYAPVRVQGDNTIVTNGDQTDTIFEEMEKGKTFEQSLLRRGYEPDRPNFTPRISGLVNIEGGMMKYYMSILKREPAEMDQVNRYTFQYANCTPGVGRFIHTYMSDGDPLPSFEGEPKPVKIEGNIERFTKTPWESLNEENKVSLFVRYITLSSGEYVSAIMNKHQVQ